MQTFAPAWESLQQYHCPDWFRDAKFGIWAHWGPQAVAMVGDWYARNMYIEGHVQYCHHLRTYGHPSRFGYKDIVKLWRAEHFDPEALIALYQSCGARYFVALAVHHDNFDCWNSKWHAWNSVQMGPRRDIVGEWARAARAAGLRFGVTEHLERAWCWFNTNKGADVTGPLAGIPYDGNDPAFSDFYTPPHDGHEYCYPANAPVAWQRHWQKRIADLVEQHDPDLLYTDGAVPFGTIGLEMIANFYNDNQRRRGGELEAVYALKDARMFAAEHGDHGEYRPGIGVLDVERGVVDGIRQEPWQTDTCIGGWYYDCQRPYKTPAEIIHMLADIVSKNGNLLLNVPLRPEGTLDGQADWTIREIGRWLAVNGPAIYGTRPWHTWGEGPTQINAGAFAESGNKPFTAADIRFTRRESTIYAMILGKPTGEFTIRALADRDVSRVELLGHPSPLSFRRDPAGLHVRVPLPLTGDYAWTLAIN